MLFVILQVLLLIMLLKILRVIELGLFTQKKIASIVNGLKDIWTQKGFKYVEKTEFDDDINKFLNKKEDNFKVTYPQIMYGKTYIGGFDEMTKYTADKYNFQKLWDTAYIATINLNQVIDKNYYPTPETKCSNMRNRPIGLGIQGLS